MTTLLHGENQTALRNRLSQIRDSFSGEIITLDGKILKEETLLQTLESGSLFEINKKLIILEEFASHKSPFERSFSIGEAMELVIVENKKISPTTLKTFQKMFGPVREEEFKVDPIVFKFLDSIEPNNRQNLLRNWLEYKKNEVPEIILVMIARQLRLLLLASSSDSEVSPDWVKLSPWQQQKLHHQSKKFTVPQIKCLFKELSEIDYKAKSGQLPLDLTSSLELLLLKI